VDLSEFRDSLREAWEEIRRFHLEAEDLAELTGDNREARAVGEAVDANSLETVADFVRTLIGEIDAFVSAISG
jgi:hypothetical protein